MTHAWRGAGDAGSWSGRGRGRVELGASIPFECACNYFVLGD